MRKLLLSFVAALSLGSPAAAATISGPTEVQAGVSYTYFYQPNLPVVLAENYNYYMMFISVDDSSTGLSTGFNIIGDVFPESATFSFNWVFNTLGTTRLSVSSVLVSYVNATLVNNNGVLSIIKSDGGFPFNSGRERDGGTGGLPVTLDISVVPIGGTLPLLLSALGAIGWVARRRKAEAALPA